MSPAVRTTPEVNAQIRAIDDWWRKNRPNAPDLFLTELAEAFDFIANSPQLGRPYRPSPVPGARRLFLSASRYHIYYLPAAEEVTVLAVWHAQRGVGPPLRSP